MTTDYEFKVIVVGDAGVGKTSMISCLLGQSSPKTYVQTQGVKVNVFRTRYQNKNIVLKLWDMSGGDNYRTYVAGYFAGSHGAIITYNMMDTETFLNIKSWYDTIHSVFEIKDPHAFESLQAIVVGLKSDSKMKEVSSDQGESAAQSIGCTHFTGNYTDTSIYPNILYKLLDMLLANAKQQEKDAKLLQNRRDYQPKADGNNDVTQPLLKKPKKEGETSSICDCGCGCTVM